MLTSGAVHLLVFLVALEHVGFLVLEMFMWERPLGLRVFGMKAEEAKVSPQDLR